MLFICPVCGYPGLTEPPRTETGGGSYEICRSCGFQFGVTDEDRGYSYAAWRRQWKEKGMRWSSVAVRQPENWNPAEQLRAVEVPD